MKSEIFAFYWEELIGGNKHTEYIQAENFRVARNEFFNTHSCPHRIDAIFNMSTGVKLL